MIKRVAIIGTGNVADQICRVLLDEEIEIAGAFSRSASGRAAFGARWKVHTFDSLSEIALEKPNLTIIAVNDSAVGEVSHHLPDHLAVVHTSGSVPMNDLKQATRGVFYPLQTFSKEKEVDWRNVPLCIEGSDEDFTAQLMNLAGKISEKVNKVDSEQRKFLHISAVFACNFSNHMYSIAHQLMDDHGMDFDMLKPLIQETAAKIQSLAPREAQTGPATRKDEKTMNAHLELLAGSEKLRHLYGLISEQIIALKDGKKL